MKRRHTVIGLAVVVVVGAAFVLLSGRWAAEGITSFRTEFVNKYGLTGTRLDTCGVCHYDFTGGGTRNPYGEAIFTRLGAGDSIAQALTNVECSPSATFGI
ncbi:MAG: hypothetical protein GTN78_01520, partial [Gemmatimonadales bacterium]|nr:hypothetical protein [Gemmatimonadales bacterium]NIN11790.1 hypothetical protein [Gemmatimonadales bacterium]NIQ98872.1 hypothetical protein [Gemmatimonadales bacterium]NIS63751.1 hypothetical protein [Gemmatimonadales bacterium]